MSLDFKSSLNTLNGFTLKIKSDKKHNKESAWEKNELITEINPNNLRLYNWRQPYRQFLSSRADFGWFLGRFLMGFATDSEKGVLAL